MILGVDLGNYAVKTSTGVIFPSKCSRVGNILSNTQFRSEGTNIYIGEGSFDTEYRKINKEFIKDLFSYAVNQSTKDSNNKVVVGLPLSQYKQDKDEFRELLLLGRHRWVTVEDVAVYPEGVAAVVGTSFEGVVIDIGGRTTDCCLVMDNYGAKKVHNPLSIPKGTLNLYSDFVKILNSRYALDLRIEDGERIIKKEGLTIDGEQVDCSMAMEVFRQFVGELINTLQVEYSLRTNNVILVGGGACLLHKALINRIPYAKLTENSIFSNAFGFRRVGEQLWR